MLTAPNPATKSSASVSDSNGEAAQRAGGLAGRLPTGRARVFAVCALAAFIATVFAYLQPVRDEPLQPPALWQQALYPIEINGVFRTSDAGTKPWLWDVFVARDGATAWAAGQADSSDSTRYVILKSRDGGDSWAPLALGEPVQQDVLSPAPLAAADTASPGGEVANAAPVQSLDPITMDPKLAAQLAESAGKKGDGSGIANAAAQQADPPVQQQQQQVQQQQQTSPPPSGSTSSGFDKIGGLHGIWMAPDGTRGWAVGDRGLILHTVDGGQVWERVATDARETLNDVALADSGDRGWVVGEAGTVLEWTGDSWRRVVNGPPSMRSVATTSDGSMAWTFGLDCQLLSLGTNETRPVASVGRSGTCYDLSVSRNGELLLVASGLDLVRMTGFRNPPPVELTQQLDALLARSVAISGDASRGWLGTEGGEILSAEKANPPWSVQFKGAGSSIDHLAVSDSGGRIVALSGGAIITSGDGGTSWHQPEYRRYPAPWLYGSWLGIFAIGFLAVRREEKLIEEQADEAVAPEIEADSPARRLIDDRLAFKPVIETLAKFLQNTGTKPPLTMAIDGEWGSGKTSMMRMLQGELQSLGFPTVWFNPWHHQKEDVMLAALVQHIRTEGLPFLLHPRGLRFRRRLILGRIQMRPFCTAFIVMGLLTPVLYFLRHRLDNPVDYFRNIIAPALDLLAALIPPTPDSVGKITASLTNPGLWLTVSFVIAAFFLVNALRAFPLSPAALLATINSKFSTQSAENQTDYRRRFGDTFALVTSALTPRPMVIFIDDLDRCLPEKALETLEATNYLASSGQCFIVLGMARTRVERLIGLASEKLAAEMADNEGSESRRVQKEADLQRELRRSYARRYLEKLVQLNVRVPSSDAKNLMSLLNAEANAADAAKRPDPLRLLRRGWTLGGFLVVLSAAAACAYGLAAFNWPDLEAPPPTVALSAPAGSTAGTGPVGGSTPTNQTEPVATPPGSTPQPTAEPAAALSSGSGIAYWPIALLVGVFVYLLYRMNLTENAPINETPYYLRAIADWNGVVVSRQRSPRSVKLFGNLARYTAMMLLEPEARQKRVARPKPLLGSGPAKETGGDAAPVESRSRARERDCVAVALASIYHVRPDILEGGSSILGGDWAQVLKKVRDSDKERYRQRLIEMQALLESRATGQAASAAAPAPQRDDEIAAAELQVRADPELREELQRLRSRSDAVEVIAETLARLPDYYGAWPPSEEILQRFSLFVMGSIQVERSEESPAALPTSRSA